MINKTVYPDAPEGMRIAEMSDFSKNKLLVQHLEYYEYMMGTFTWELNITGIHTDRAWLKTKIELGYVAVHLVPRIWNYKNVSILQQAS